MSVRHALRAAAILSIAFAATPASSQTIRYANQGVLNLGNGHSGLLNAGGGSLLGLAPGGHLLGIGG